MPFDAEGILNYHFWHGSWREKQARKSHNKKLNISLTLVFRHGPTHSANICLHVIKARNIAFVWLFIWQQCAFLLVRTRQALGKAVRKDSLCGHRKERISQRLPKSLAAVRRQDRLLKMCNIHRFLFRSWNAYDVPAAGGNLLSGAFKVQHSLAKMLTLDWTTLSNKGSICKMIQKNVFNFCAWIASTMDDKRKLNWSYKKR